jgi:hypothetical protein
MTLSEQAERRRRDLKEPATVFISVNLEQFDEDDIEAIRDTIGADIANFIEFHRGRDPERIYNFKLWESYETQESIEVTDFRTNSGRFVGMPLRELPRTLSLSLRTSNDVSLFGDVGLPNYMGQVGVLRALKGHLVDITTNTIPSFSGVVREVNVSDDGQYKDVVRVNLEVRELTPQDFGDAARPERIRLRIPPSTPGWADMTAHQRNLLSGGGNNEERCHDYNGITIPTMAKQAGSTFATGARLVGHGVSAAVSATGGFFKGVGSVVSRGWNRAKEITEDALDATVMKVLPGDSIRKFMRHTGCFFTHTDERALAETRARQENFVRNGRSPNPGRLLPSYSRQIEFLSRQNDELFMVNAGTEVPFTQITSRKTGRMGARMDIMGHRITVATEYNYRTGSYNVLLTIDGEEIDRIRATPFSEYTYRNALPGQIENPDLKVAVITDDPNFADEDPHPETVEHYRVVLYHGRHVSKADPRIIWEENI